MYSPYLGVSLWQNAHKVFIASLYRCFWACCRELGRRSRTRAIRQDCRRHKGLFQNHNRYCSNGQCRALSFLCECRLSIRLYTWKLTADCRIPCKVSVLQLFYRETILIPVLSMFFRPALLKLLMCEPAAVKSEKQFSHRFFGVVLRLKCHTAFS